MNKQLTIKDYILLIAIDFVCFLICIIANYLFFVYSYGINWRDNPDLFDTSQLILNLLITGFILKSLYWGWKAFILYVERPLKKKE
jgi:hypothetical protein